MSNIQSRFAALLLALAIAGCSGTPSQQGSGQYFDDSVITTKVKAAFVKDEVVDATDISVTTFNGTVQLSGHADSSAEIARAVQLTQAVRGVKAIRSDISLRVDSE